MFCPSVRRDSGLHLALHTSLGIKEASSVHTCTVLPVPSPNRARVPDLAICRDLPPPASTAIPQNRLIAAFVPAWGHNGCTSRWNSNWRSKISEDAKACVRSPIVLLSFPKSSWLLNHSHIMISSSLTASVARQSQSVAVGDQ
jgi:hypothetical protein